MGVVLLRARAELRSRLRSWVALSLLVGLTAGLVIAAAAGARRTDSAYERFLERQRAADVIVANYPDPGLATFDPAAVERLPQVAVAARAAFFFLANDSGALAPADSRLGRDVNRLKVVDGRLAAPDRVEEVVVGFERARLLHLHVGSEFPLFGREEVEAAARLGLRNIRLHVVGLVAAPGEFPPLAQGGPSIIFTPAFYRAYDRTALGRGAGRAVIIRLRHGAADLPAFRAELTRLAGGKPFALSVQAEEADAVERSLHLQAVALWVLAALLGAAGVMVLSQALARQVFLESGDGETLRALGVTRRQLWALGLIRALVTSAIGAVVALGVAVALSPLTPIGTIARAAEPDPGVSVDPAVFGAGLAGTVLVTVLLTAPVAWFAARGRPAPAGPTPGGRSRVVRAAARLGAGAAVTTGLRMALEPGRGSTAVPVRTTLAGVTLAVTAFAAALTFGASSAHLLETPRLYGWNWDLAVTHYGAGPDLGGRSARIFLRDPAIAEFATGALGVPLAVNGARVDAVALDPGRGTVLPPIVEGRAPDRPGEIALGARTMRALHLEIGEAVAVRVADAGARRMRVVGKGVLASTFSSAARLGSGAIMRYSDVRALAGRIPASDAVLRLRPGADRRALLKRLRRSARHLGPLPMQKPSDIVDFGRVRALPVILAALLGALALATLTHILVTGVTRRRRDLAVLKVLGFVRRQVGVVVLTQSLTIVGVALVVGVPLGAAVGRLAWSLFSEQQGAVTEVVIPVGAIALVVPAALLAASLLALLPARFAAGTAPAATLRSE